MREHPILMKGPLVRATLAGRKTQIRKPVKIGSVTASGGTLHQEWVRIPRSKEILLLKGEGALADLKRLPVACPLGQPGDRLWVRETWTSAMHEAKNPADCLYRADDNRGVEDLAEAKWTPSIHMPRWACRLVLPLVSVRVERVQSITEADAWAEGYGEHWQQRIKEAGADGSLGRPSPIGWFALLWESIYGNWKENPWVWVAEWKEIEVSK